MEVTTRRTTREAGRQAWTYLLNHTSKTQTVTLTGTYTDAHDRAAVSGPVQLKPYGVRVLLSA